MTATLSAAEARALLAKPKRRQSEFELQRAVAAYLEAVLPRDALWSAIDHAGRGPRDGALMYARGVRKGLPDFIICEDALVIWIELKAGKNGLTAEQSSWRCRLEEGGCFHFICRSVTDVEAALYKMAIPLRGKRA